MDPVALAADHPVAEQLGCQLDIESRPYGHAPENSNSGWTNWLSLEVVRVDLIHRRK